MKLKELGAWSGYAAFKNPKKYVSLIKSTKINRLDLMVNDGTRKGGFHLYENKQKLIDTLKMFKDETGIDLSITTWAKPEKSWIDGMLEVGEIATKAELDEINLDLEEPWIIPLKNKSDIEILTWSIGLTNTLKLNFSNKIAIAPIVYANRKVLEYMFRECDIIIPQCYSTVKNATGKPGSLEQTTVNLYKGYDKEIIMGAAAWNLNGAYGLSTRDAIRASLTSTLDNNIFRVRYWRFEHLQGEILSTIKEFI